MLSNEHGNKHPLAQGEQPSASIPPKCSKMCVGEEESSRSEELLGHENMQVCLSVSGETF